jgi:hypothetical protein
MHGFSFFAPWDSSMSLLPLPIRSDSCTPSVGTCTSHTSAQRNETAMTMTTMTTMTMTAMIVVVVVVVAAKSCRW